MKICIDAGHGGKDPGAIGDGVKEKDLALKFALKLGALFELWGDRVVHTRKIDTFRTLGQRTRIANQSKADVFISIHCNAAVDKRANGIELLVWNTRDWRKFADEFKDIMLRHFRINWRGMKSRKDLWVLRKTKMKAILIEAGFITNLRDRQLLQTDKFCNILTAATALAIRRQYG